MFNISIPELLELFPATGELLWIGIRPERYAPVLCLDHVAAEQGIGLSGDHYRSPNGKRQVTLLQWEHLSVLSALMGKPIAPEMLRRNLVVKGINLLALKNRQFQIADAIFQTTGLCQPCSRMESILGEGGYNAMRGHGGITAEIVRNGTISVGDKVTVLADVET